MELKQTQNPLKDFAGLAFEYGHKPSMLFFLVIGIFFTINMLLAFWQVNYGYASGEGLDVTPWQFLLPLAMFYFVAFCGAYALRGLIIRWRLFRHFRRLLYVAEYKFPQGMIGAAEAGYILDATWDVSENDSILAELLANEVLEYRDGRLILRERAETQRLKYYQKAFIDRVFKSTNELHVSSRSKSMPKTNHIGRMIKLEMIRRGYVSDNTLKPWLRKLFRISFYIALFSVVANAAHMLRHGIESVLYNHGETYPVEIWQVVLSFGIPLIIVATIVNGMTHKIVKSHTGLTNWRYVAGFKLYLETVYKDRLKSSFQGGLDFKTAQEIFPYAIAFKVASLKDMLALYVQNS